MKLFLKKHPYLRLLLWSGMLPFLSVVLGLTCDAYNPFGGGVTNPVVSGMVDVTWPLWMLLAAAHVFGVTELLLYGMLVNDRMLEALGLKRILPTALMAAVGSYFLMCLLSFPPHDYWLDVFWKLGTLFAVLPTLAVVLLRYGLWRWHRRKKQP